MISGVTLGVDQCKQAHHLSTSYHQKQPSGRVRQVPIISQVMTASQQLRKQYLRARSEVETSILNAKTLRDQWLAASSDGVQESAVENDAQQLSKTLKNQLLTLKWDCEDLEELVSASENETSYLEPGELVEVKNYIEECRNSATKILNLLDGGVGSVNKLYNKHATTATLTSSRASSELQSPSSPITSNNHLNDCNEDDIDEVQFDKTSLMGASGEQRVFSNALYDHYEQQAAQHQLKHQQSFNSSQVFGNLSRPATNVYVNPNENEIILDMLETEYYRQPAALEPKFRLSHSVRKLIETDRNKFLRTIAIMFSFPILLIIFLVM